MTTKYLQVEVALCRADLRTVNSLDSEGIEPVRTEFNRRNCPNVEQIQDEKRLIIVFREGMNEREYIRHGDKPKIIEN